MNCTVHVRNADCEIWVGTQAIARVQAAAAKTAGLPLEKVVVHNHLIGGGFGRRLEVDGVIRAVEIAKQVDGPVKVIWTREEDIQHDMYRPYFFDRISAGLDANGMPVAWNHRFAGSSVIARWLPPGFNKGIDRRHGRRRDRSRLRPPEPARRVCARRAARHSDRLLAQRRSFAQRVRDRKLRRRACGRGEEGSGRVSTRAPRQVSARESRARACRAESPAGASRCPTRVGRGVSVQFAFATYMAQVAEVEVSKDGAVRVRRVVCAVDCGTVVNPDTVQAQIQSAVMFGVTAVLYGEITLKDGRVEQSNFDTYRVLRMNEAPTVEVHIVQSAEPPGGMGEAGTSCIVPAVANAVFAATGKRLRKLPLDATALKQSA